MRKILIAVAAAILAAVFWTDAPAQAQIGYRQNQEFQRDLQERWDDMRRDQERETQRQNDDWQQYYDEQHEQRMRELREQDED
jgi:hypothetical protein